MKTGWLVVQQTKQAPCRFHERQGIQSSRHGGTEDCVVRVAAVNCCADHSVTRHVVSNSVNDALAAAFGNTKLEWSKVGTEVSHS